MSTLVRCVSVQDSVQGILVLRDRRLGETPRIRA